MLTTVRGTYRQGRIELDEDPRIDTETAVVVTFLDGNPPPGVDSEKRIMTSGMLAVPGKRMSEESDFDIAKFDESRWERG